MEFKSLNPHQVIQKMNHRDLVDSSKQGQKSTQANCERMLDIQLDNSFLLNSNRGMMIYAEPNTSLLFII